MEGINIMRKVNFLSVVIPCHNEQEALSVSLARLSSVLDALCKSSKISDYELIFVDNGSTDKTAEVLKEIFDGNTKAKVISLRRNFGYQGSISAGLYYAKGDAVVTIDADLQDPPEKIGEMLDYYETGFDLVLGIRQDRSADSFLKKFFSENYYRFMKFIGVEIVYNHGDFRLMSKSLVQEFNMLHERNRFIRAMVLQLESRYAKVFYKRSLRLAGKSKFDIKSLFSIGFDGVLSFSYVPLRIASLVGILLCFLAMLGVGWVFYIKIKTHVMPGWASTLLPILGLGGFQLLMLGLIGEYIGRLYLEVKARPLFVVREFLARKDENK